MAMAADRSQLHPRAVNVTEAVVRIAIAKKRLATVLLKAVDGGVDLAYFARYLAAPRARPSEPFSRQRKRQGMSWAGFPS
jgi:hypothetical protein